MENMLKVTPERLIETAGEFQNTEAGIRAITQEMISVVDSFKPVWQGEAATGFSARFASLSDDMNKLYALIPRASIRSTRSERTPLKSSSSCMNRRS